MASLSYLAYQVLSDPIDQSWKLLENQGLNSHLTTDRSETIKVKPVPEPAVLSFSRVYVPYKLGARIEIITRVIPVFTNNQFSHYEYWLSDYGHNKEFGHDFFLTRKGAIIQAWKDFFY